MASLAPSANALASPLAVQRNGEKPVDLNIKSVVLGDVSFKAWYPSFYPDQLVGGELDSLYVCKCCFKYSKDVMPYLVHIVRSPRFTMPPKTHTDTTVRNTATRMRRLRQAVGFTLAAPIQSTKSMAKTPNSSPKTYPSSPNSS